MLSWLGSFFWPVYVLSCTTHLLLSPHKQQLFKRWYGPKSKYNLFWLRRFIGLVAKITVFFKGSTEWSVTHVGDWRSAYKVLVGRPEGRNHLENLGVDWMIILRLIFKKWDGAAWNELIRPRIEAAGGCLWMW